MKNIIYSSAIQIAKAIREKKVTSQEVLIAFLDQIAKYNPKLNSLVTSNEKEAIKRAKEADSDLKKGKIWGPLHGVPITIKDSYETKGLRTTSSYKPLANYIPAHNATVVQRMLDAGVIIIGKTNLPELAMDWQSNSPVFGKANNPWDLNRTPGGSTGGGAACVAAGLSPLEIGSDLGGSIRIPAHFCGIFGLKPTENRISFYGHIPEVPDSQKGVRHMAVPGVLAHSIEDLQLCLSILEGADNLTTEVPPVLHETISKNPLNKLKLAWTDNFGNVPITSDTRNLIKKFIGKLEKAGCNAEQKKPLEFDFEKAWKSYGEITGCEIGAVIPLISRILYNISFGLMPGKSSLKTGFCSGIKIRMQTYFKALTIRDSLITILENFLSNYDAWICPVSPTPAFTHRKSGTLIEVDQQKLSYILGGISYTSIFNLTGNPVVVIPIGYSKEGLPIGVQIVGKRWTDMQLLETCKKIVPVVDKPLKPKLI